ncbi:hypothetical protein FACS1894166_09840 [Bacilli bacterium]|nr:hypothetical protein FACS1894166_09840 [Bacilli bacterium]
MQCYSLINKKCVAEVQLPKNLSLSKKTDKKCFIVCQNSEMGAFDKMFNVASTLQASESTDENIRYSSYDDYDFLSLKVLEKDMRLVEVNAFICANFILFVIPRKIDINIEGVAENNTIADKIVAAVENRINKVLAKAGDKNILNKVLYFILDAVIDDYALWLEKIEDLGEAIKKDIVATSKKEWNKNNQQYLNRANDFHNQIFTVRKQIRAMQKLIILDENENGFIAKEEMGMFDGIKTRLNALLGHASDIYELSDKISHDFDAKTNTHLNKAMTVLAAIQIITLA